MWVLEEEKLCYLANPKTASLATAYTLETLGFKHYGDQHCTPDQSGWERRQEIDDTWIIFSTVRNHYDVMVSWYFHNTIRPGASKYFGWPFERFLYEWAHNPQWFRNNQMYGVRNPWCNRILRYETLQTDFNCLLKSLGFPPTLLQVHNVSRNRKKRPYHEFYTDKSVAFMEDRFGAEMRLLNYGYWQCT
jgi:hypothetical protein